MTAQLVSNLRSYAMFPPRHLQWRGQMGVSVFPEYHSVRMFDYDVFMAVSSQIAVKQLQSHVENETYDGTGLPQALMLLSLLSATLHGIGSDIRYL